MTYAVIPYVLEAISEVQKFLIFLPKKLILCQSYFHILSYTEAFINCHFYFPATAKCSNRFNILFDTDSIYQDINELMMNPVK